MVTVWSSLTRGVWPWAAETGSKARVLWDHKWVLSPSPRDSFLSICVGSVDPPSGFQRTFWIQAVGENLPIQTWSTRLAKQALFPWRRTAWWVCCVNPRSSLGDGLAPAAQEEEPWEPEPGGPRGAG